jgi:hypothetical protein
MALHVATEQILGSGAMSEKKEGTMQVRRSRGRPRKHSSESRREIFYFRANPELAKKIRQQSAVLGKSYTEQIEMIIEKHYSYENLARALTQDRKDLIRESIREVLFELIKCEKVIFLLQNNTPLADAWEAGLGSLREIGKDVKMADQKIE